MMHDDGMTQPQNVAPYVGSAPRGQYQTQLVPAKTSHILHLIMTCITFGMWSPVWLIITLYNHNRSVPQQVWQQTPMTFDAIHPGWAPHVYDHRAPSYPGWGWCFIHDTWERN